MDSTIVECLVCLQSPKQAVETQCCGQIFCEECLNCVENKICPACRKENVKSYPSQTVRKLLERQETECPNKCGLRFNLSELMQHMKLCEKNRIVCPAPDCSSKFDDQDRFLSHLIEEHKQKTFRNSRLLFQASVDSESQTEKFNEPMWARSGYDPSEPVINEEGRKARLSGENGKFYCARATTKICMKIDNHLAVKCDCCNGSYISCGPTSGCNCEPCQKLDLQYRGIAKEVGWLVSRNGALCKFIPVKERKCYHDGHFVCGRQVNEVTCGYFMGQMCAYCKDLLDHVKRGQYKNLLEQLPATK